MTRRLLAFSLLCLVVASPASAQLQIPASWSGLWDVTTTERACGSTTVIDMFVEADTLCAGEVFTAGDEAEFECTGSIDDNSANVSCTGLVEEGPCSITFAFDFNVTRSGDTYTGTESFSVTYSGCGPIPDQCIEADISAVRTGPTPTSCPTTAITTVGWDFVKTLYN